MIVKRITRVNSEFNIKAAENNGSLTGIIRMTARTPVSKVIGICSLFETDINKQNLFFNKDNLFFYGSDADLAFNYWGNVLKEGKKRDDYQDREIAMPHHTVHTYSIPLDEMKLSYLQKDILKLVLEEAENGLQGLVNGLTRIEIDQCDPNSRRRYKKMFWYFTKVLQAEAEKKGYFFTNDTMKSKRIVDRIEMPRTGTIISTPVGGLPDWARDYMRKRR